MTRRLFTAASALSLGLCVLIGTLWIRSYWAGDSCFLRTHSANYSCEAGNGRLWLAWHAWRSSDIELLPRLGSSTSRHSHRAGFRRQFRILPRHAKKPRRRKRLSLVFPIWPPRSSPWCFRQASWPASCAVPAVRGRAGAPRAAMTSAPARIVVRNVGWRDRRNEGGSKRRGDRILSVASASAGPPKSMSPNVSLCLALARFGTLFSFLRCFSNITITVSPPWPF